MSDQVLPNWTSFLPLQAASDVGHCHDLALHDLLLLTPTHWAHKFSVEFKSFGGRVRDVV